jgi:hypothetical protein
MSLLVVNLVSLGFPLLLLLQHSSPLFPLLFATLFVVAWAIFTNLAFLSLTTLVSLASPVSLSFLLSPFAMNVPLQIPQLPTSIDVILANVTPSFFSYLGLGYLGTYLHP